MYFRASFIFFTTVVDYEILLFRARTSWLLISIFSLQLLIYLRVMIQTTLRHLRGGPLSIMERTQSMGKRGEAFARSREKWRMQVP